MSNFSFYFTHQFYRKNPVAALTALLIGLLFFLPILPQNVQAVEWQTDFGLENRQLADNGESAYFILQPGFQTVLEYRKVRLTITVLDETKEIGGVVTRVVEEREEKNGRLLEISKNFFAIDRETGDVFYFGEEVDNYNRKGAVKNHHGSWLAFDGDNKPGLIMPARPQVGMMYYQEIAPGKAMDRAEVTGLMETFVTPAGEFSNCLRTRESSKIKTLLVFSPTEEKVYAPGIGLIQDVKLKLTRYGFLDKTGNL